jgi:hypothetical protein
VTQRPATEPPSASPGAGADTGGDEPDRLTDADRELLAALGVVARRTPPRRFSWTPFVLFGLTLFTTTWSGAYGFGDAPFGFIPAWRWHAFVFPGLGIREFLAAPGTLLHGWTFSVPLMAILVCHEMGHWVTARLHGVHQSLPHFIPFPMAFGTFGAVIRMDARVPDRNVLLDIGVMGPIAGMVVAIPVMLIGLHFAPVVPLTYPALVEGNSLLYLVLKFLMKGPIPPGYDVFIGNVATAGWLGFYLTMLNLFPIGQLDGGHVAYAAMRRPEPVFTLANALLFANGLLVTAFMKNSLGYGFIFMGVLVFFFARFHPPVVHPERPLTFGRRLVALGALLLWIATYVPVPWTELKGPA